MRTVKFILSPLLRAKFQILSFKHDWVLCLLFLFLFSGCATGKRSLADEAAQMGFSRLILPGRQFQHVAYMNKSSGPPNVLHVYLEGDGSAWIREDRIASDPTPRNPLMLRMMTFDRSPSLYLGRPCYDGLADTPPCQPYYWTIGRFSPRVVDSMVDALQNFLEQGSYTEIIFFGYSGGGVLAMLLAERFEQTSQVVTVAANLDTDAWCRYHEFTELAGSLNPASREPLSPNIRQLHLAGALDREVPSFLIKPVADRQLNSNYIVIQQYGHRCCWETLWPSILKILQTGNDNLELGRP